MECVHCPPTHIHATVGRINIHFKSRVKWHSIHAHQKLVQFYFSSLLIHFTNDRVFLHQCTETWQYTIHRMTNIYCGSFESKMRKKDWHACVLFIFKWNLHHSQVTPCSNRDSYIQFNVFNFSFSLIHISSSSSLHLQILLPLRLLMSATATR